MAVSSTIFNQIPAALRIPGWHIEFDNRLAGNAVFQGKLLVIGQRMDTGSQAAGSLARVTSPEQAEDYYGRGSMLAEMFHAIKGVDRYLETWAIALDDAAAGVAASGAIEVTQATTEPRPMALYIAGYRLWVRIGAGDSLETIAASIAAAVNADSRVPVTAEVDGTTASRVNLTCKWRGETGNDIDLRLSARGEEVPSGLRVTISDFSSGAVNPAIEDAIAAMGSEWWNWLVMPYTDTVSLVSLETELDARYGPMRQIGCRAFAAYRGTHSETGTFGSARNSPHVSIMGTGPAVSPTWLWAATNAIAATRALAIDPARPLQTLAMPGLIGPSPEDRWDDPERNLLLYDGIATYTVATDGTLRIERQITTYQENAAGIADDSYLDINTPETLERIRFEQISLFAQKYPRHKLAKDEDRKLYDPSQPVMTPKIARAELTGMYRGVFMGERAWVRDYEGYVESLLADVDPDDPNRLNIVDSPQLISGYRVHAQQTQFRR